MNTESPDHTLRCFIDLSLQYAAAARGEADTGLLLRQILKNYSKLNVEQRLTLFGKIDGHDYLNERPFHLKHVSNQEFLAHLEWDVEILDFVKTTGKLPKTAFSGCPAVYVAVELAKCSDVELYHR